MRIIECYIKGFGGLRDVRIEFGDGLNTFIGDNGVGKSTIASFIKAMLYGIGETRKVSIEENDRKHYLPWDGGSAGGSMTFIAGNVQYRVERTFGKRPADDTFTIYDTRLGKEITSLGSNIGEALLGIDAEGFERTAFFSERNLVPEADVASSGAAAEDGVSEELSSGALADALAILDEQRKFYQKKGGGGAIADTKRDIAAIDAELEQLELTKKRAMEAEESIIRLEAERKAELSKARDIAERKAKLQARQTMQRADLRIKELRSEIFTLNEKKDALIEFFAGEVPPRGVLDELDYKSKRAAELKATENAFKEKNDELERLSSLFEGRLSIEEADRARQAVNVLEQTDPRAEKCKKVFSKRIPTHAEVDGLISKHTSSKKAPILIWTIIGALLAGVGVALGVIISPFCFVACALGIISMAVGIVSGVASGAKHASVTLKTTEQFLSSIGEKSALSQEGLSALIEVKGLIDEALSIESRLESAKQILFDLCRKFPTHSGSCAESAKLILDKFDSFLSLSQGSIRNEISPAITAEILLSEIAEALAKYKIETGDPISEVKGKQAEYERITEKIISFNRELMSLSSMSGLESDDEVCDDTAEGLDEAARATNAKITSCDRDLAILGREYDRDMRALEARESLAIEKGRLLDTLSARECDLKAIQGAMSYLKSASEAMNEKYLAGALQSFRDYTALLGLTDESYEMKTDYSASVVDGTGTHSTESYSRGTRDGYRLASRLAILDSLYSGERAFLLLDDPFVSFDDERAKAALSLIEKIGEERQVIYLTCSESRVKGSARRLN